MPDVAENAEIWNNEASWSRAGDEWSDPWGGTQSMWLATVLPRIDAFVPTDTILEIAPGHGRWSNYLKDLCRQLALVDLSETCIANCRARFSDATNISYHVNDGRSLAMVEDESVDFAFSFDSLVHAEIDVLRAYVDELARTLKPDGVALLHHANMGEYRRQARFARAVPDRLRRQLTLRGLIVNVYSWRAESVTAERVAQHSEAVGLQCVGQEKLAWVYGRFLTDAISVITRPGSRWSRENRVVRNSRFSDEAAAAARRSQLYDRAAFPNHSASSPPSGEAPRSAVAAPPN